MIDELAEIILGEELVALPAVEAVEELPFDEVGEAHVRGFKEAPAEEECDDPRGFMEDDV